MIKQFKTTIIKFKSTRYSVSKQR